MRRRVTYILVLTCMNMNVYSGPVLLSILNEQTLSAVVISPDKGNYAVIADGRDIGYLNENDVLYISMFGEYLMASHRSGSHGIFSSVSLRATGHEGGFSVRPVQPSLDKAYYHGDLDIRVEYERMSLINLIDEKLYIAGVIEAESGTKAPLMYYRAHAIICRTYLYGNINRHAGEGFHVCDQVHCQAYKGRLTGSKEIMEAVVSTEGLVIISADSALITAAFHSNCGGETANSEDVWLIHRPYLRSVNDPYCGEGPNSAWQTTIDTGDWERYLKGLGRGSSSSGDGGSACTIRQQKRMVDYVFNGLPVPFRKIRSDWNFRSAWFDIEPLDSGSRLLITGRGYGHGAGLCQEGAMEMAARGYNFVEILQFYYTDIEVTDKVPLSRP